MVEIEAGEADGGTVKFCQAHWDKLREAIRARGLYELVAADGTEAVRRTMSELGSVRSKSNFDPLMAAHWAIVNNVMAGPAGLAIMMQNEDGSDRCPLCFIRDDHLARCAVPGCEVKDFDWMIERASDDSLSYAKELGLVGDC